uniref:Mitotic spindle checkpoint protein MAD2 n=3 Tax=Aegilops tauschii subsp. strangulata TaxID=200361 RepID=A0A453C922_AEGTS
RKRDPTSQFPHFPSPFHSPAAASLPVAPLSSSPESQLLARRTHSRREREREEGKAPPRGRPRPRSDGVEDGVQGHHHAQGLRRHRQRVLRLRGQQVRDGPANSGVVSIPDAGLFEMERVRAKFWQWGLIRGVWCGCSILYNRGVYPEESFGKVKKYGLPMLLTQDKAVKTFLTNLTSQLSEWLEGGKLQRIVLVIMSKATGEVLERWNFNIITDGEVVEKGAVKEKSDKEIMREIQAIMRQVNSCISFLPCLDEPCIFDVLAYTDSDTTVPFTWMESDAKLIENPQMVKLHSFDTKIHKVDTLVSYKVDDLDEQ